MSDKILQHLVCAQELGSRARAWFARRGRVNYSQLVHRRAITECTDIGCQRTLFIIENQKPWSLSTLMSMMFLIFFVELSMAHQFEYVFNKNFKNRNDFTIWQSFHNYQKSKDFLRLYFDWFCWQLWNHLLTRNTFQELDLVEI